MPLLLRNALAPSTVLACEPIPCAIPMMISSVMPTVAVVVVVTVSGVVVTVSGVGTTALSTGCRCGHSGGRGLNCPHLLSGLTHLSEGRTALDNCL